MEPAGVLVDATELQESARKKLSRYPVPCFRLGRLAVHKDLRGQSMGKLLLACAVDRCLKARRDVAAFAMIVDAKDDKAKQFYEHYGCVAFTGQPLTLYLGLGHQGGPAL